MGGKKGDYSVRVEHHKDELLGVCCHICRAWRDGSFDRDRKWFSVRSLDSLCESYLVLLYHYIGICNDIICICGWWCIVNSQCNLDILSLYFFIFQVK